MERTRSLDRVAFSFFFNFFLEHMGIWCMTYGKKEQGDEPLQDDVD